MSESKSRSKASQQKIKKDQERTIIAKSERQTEGMSRRSVARREPHERTKREQRRRKEQSYGAVNIHTIQPERKQKQRREV